LIINGTIFASNLRDWPLWIKQDKSCEVSTLLLSTWNKKWSLKSCFCLKNRITNLENRRNLCILWFWWKQSWILCISNLSLWRRIWFQSTFINAGYLLADGKPYYALALVGLIIPQIVFQVKNASWNVMSL
jgi:hypothetical protein